MNFPLILSVCLYTTVAGIDEGFDLFFATNLDEMTDVPIHFENPLPTWLKGTLVRLLFKPSCILHSRKKVYHQQQPEILSFSI